MRRGLGPALVIVAILVIADINARNDGKNYYHLWSSEVKQDVWIVILIVLLVLWRRVRRSK